jgi:hypothetical protein
MDRVTQIHRRQTARLLDHLERTRQLTNQLRSDILRSHGFIFEDVRAELDRIKQGHGKETDNDSKQVV